MKVDFSQAPLETQGYLSLLELQKLSTFRFPKRRDEWLLGRWTAKALAHSLPNYSHYHLDQIEIRNTPEGAPYIQLPGDTKPAGCLAISHSNHFALCALSPGLNLRIGVDLEKIETRTETFILDYFTPAERRLVDAYPAETRSILVTLIWSAKESMLKALGVGLRWDTRSVEISGLDGIQHAQDIPGKWRMIQVGEQIGSTRAWAAWWQCQGQFILTLAGFAATPAGIQSTRLIEQQIEKK